ncbi:MAG: hypothetical protein ACR2LV_09455 [Solirubrobacteraceae bacterium]
MPTSPSQRSVKIASDERRAWSSERPRSDGAPPRQADISTRCRVLTASDRLRYSPGSLVLLVSGVAEEAVALAERVVEERGAVLSPTKVRSLLEGRVGADELEDKAQELLKAAVIKRLDANQSVLVTVEGLGPEQREAFVRPAHARRRPAHLILLETARDRVPEEMRSTLNELRRALDTGEVGREGFQTALRLGGRSIGELNRIVFQPPPREH